MNEHRAHQYAEILLNVHRPEIKQCISDDEINIRMQSMHKAIRERYARSKT
jgi:hypothetical protein